MVGPSVGLGQNVTNCYKFKYDPSFAFNWYEAWRSCKQENSELLVIENMEEMLWFSKIINADLNSVTPNYKDFDAEGWYLNMHRLLYGNGYLSWADGREILAELTTYFTGISIADPKPIFGKYQFYQWYCFFLTKRRYLKNIECGESKTGIGYVCKKRFKHENTVASVICNAEKTALSLCPSGWVEPQA